MLPFDERAVRMAQAVASSSTVSNESSAFTPKLYPTPVFHDPIRLIKLECRQNDEKLVQELRNLLDDGMLYLDPYLVNPLRKMYVEESGDKTWNIFRNYDWDHIIRGWMSCCEAFFAQYMKYATETLAEKKLKNVVIMGDRSAVAHRKNFTAETIVCQVPLIRYNTTVALEQQHLYLLEKNGKRLPLIRKVIYLVLKIYLPALRSWLERCWPVVWRLYSSPLVQTIVSGADFLSFAWFLSTGDYPRLVDRLCGVSIKQSGPRRRFHWALPRQVQHDFYGAAVVSVIRVLPWRQILLIIRSILTVIPLRKLMRRFLPEIPSGNCPVCALSLNYPCNFRCGHAVCYWCLESSCRVPWTSWIFCPCCINFTRSVSADTE